MSRTRQRLEALVARVRTEVHLVLLLEHGVRLTPAQIVKLDKLVYDALNAAKLIGKLHAARPEDADDTPTDDELADTRPMKSRPPPKH